MEENAISQCQPCVHASFFGLVCQMVSSYARGAVSAARTMSSATPLLRVLVHCQCHVSIQTLTV